MASITKPDAVILREIREALNLTTAELAAEIETPVSLLELWEAGTTKPRTGLWRTLVALIAERGHIILETSAEAADRRQRIRERTRAAEIASIAAEMNAAQPPRRRRNTKPTA